MLRDIFGLAEHQEKATYGLGCMLFLTRNSDNSVLNKDNATNIGKIKNNSIEWYVWILYGYLLGFNKGKDKTHKA